jgi:AcrR family transcriptional regulator
MYLCAIMEDTRARILQENYKAVHRFGFQGTRTDKVVAELGITKGAFYHYFPTKNDLGYAIVDEIILPNYTSIWKAFEHATEHFEVVLTETTSDVILCALIAWAREELICWRYLDQFARTTI